MDNVIDNERIYEIIRNSIIPTIAENIVDLETLAQVLSEYPDALPDNRVHIIVSSINDFISKMNESLSKYD